ncbi:hypothetical protein G6F35_014276 [Rhizopus arrhizus]|nr:hypothetical protein G6F35_014276 [Rhizopus arrhizus]
MARRQLVVQRHARQVGAHHGHAYRVRRRLAGGDAGRQRCAGGAQRQTALRLPKLAELRQRAVLPGQAYQSDAGRQAVGAHARRHRQRRQVGQVGKVGVDAQPRIQGDRIGLQLGDRVDGGGCRHDQCVESRQGLMDLTRQFGAAVLGLEGVQRAVVRRLLHDAAHHGVDDVRRVLPQRFHGGETLGHPRPLIQQRGQLVERREVDGGHFRAGDLQGAHGIVEAGSSEERRVGIGCWCGWWG